MTRKESKPIRKKKKSGRDDATPVRAKGFKVDKSPAARAFGKAVSETHKRLYGE